MKMVPRSQQRRVASIISDRSGLTLIHLLVGISVLGVLLVAASPNIGTISRIYTVRAGARQVYSELQNLRMAALTENTTYTFTATAGSTSYAVQGVSKSLEVGSQGVTLSAATISFAPNGTAPSNGTVTVTDSQGTAIQVAVGPAGRVRIQ